MKSRRALVRSSRKKGLSRQNKKHFWITWGVLVLAAFLLVGAIWGLRQPQVRITNVVIQGVETLDTETLESLVWEYLAGAYVFVVPKSSVFFYPRTDIEEQLLSSFTRLSSVRAYTKNVSTLVVEVEEYEPAYAWCGSTYTKGAVPTECYFANNEGYLFAKAPYFYGSVFLIFYGELAYSEEPLRNMILPEQEFNDAVSLMNALGNVGLDAIRVVREGEKDISIHTQKGFELKVALSDPPTDTLTRLDSLLAELEDTHDLAYIDLRFGNKIFYKYNNAE